MKFDATSEQMGYRPRMATFSLCVVTLVLVCMSQEAWSIMPVERPVARDCAKLVNQSGAVPSPARGDAFIDCIVRQSPSATTNDLRHRLETGNGAGLFDRLMDGEELPIESDLDCPYLRVAVQSPLGSDEAIQKPMRDLFSSALERAGFTIVEAGAMHHWWASSLALDTGGNSLAWTILLRAVPEIGNGSIRFTSVRKIIGDREGSFSGMQSLRAFSIAEAPEAARLAAEGIARELLPTANGRCEDYDATVEAARIRHLEQLRSELVEEIERVQRRRAMRKETNREKHLEIEVEG